MIKLKTLFLISVMLFIIGCQTQQQTMPTYVDVHKGTDGLKMDFLETAPPEEVYSKETFHAGIEVENRGAFDISKGYLALAIEDDYMDVPEDAWEGSSLTGKKGKEIRTFDLEGKSRFNPKGRGDTITVKLESKEIDPQSETHTSIVMITACYKYKTELSTEVCVDTDPYSLKQKVKACEIQEKSFSGQGAPVAVTKVEPKMLPHDSPNFVKPSFMIYIKNKGNGEVVNKNNVMDACSSINLSHEAFNTIFIKAKLSDEPLDCSPKEIQGSETKEGYIRLKEKEDFVRCTLTAGVSKSVGTYSTPLTVELDYGYTLSVSRDVEILKELEY